MSENAAVDTPIVNDAITSDDAGFVGNAGEQVVEELIADQESQEVETEETESNEDVEVQAETVDELEQEIEEAIEEGATEEEVADMIREFELKVNGKTIKRKIDLSDEDAVKRELQKAYAGQLAMQEKKEYEKYIQSELERLQNDPWAVLQELGHDPNELAYKKLQEQVEEESKPEEQRIREQMERELTEARELLKQQQEEAESARYEQLKAQAEAELETEIYEALDAHKSLPRSQKTVIRIADAMAWAMENGFEDVKAEDVIPAVEEEIREEISGLLSEAPEEMFESYVGKKNIERYRQKRLNSIKPTPSSDVKPTTKAMEIKKETKKDKKLKSKDYFRNL